MSGAEVIEAMFDRVAPELRRDALEFEETDPRSSCPSFRLKNHRGERLFVLRFSSDARKYFPWFVQHRPGLTSCCDYAVFVARGDVLHVLLLELKSSNGKGAAVQLKGGLQICEYLVRNVCRHAALTMPSMRFHGVVVAASRAPTTGRPTDPLPYTEHAVLTATLRVCHIAPPDGFHLERFLGA